MRVRHVWALSLGLLLSQLPVAALAGDDDDADGVHGSDDACPQLAEDDDDFQDEDGCPDRDNDRDGITDGRDECPLAAEDMDDFADTDGCPEGDNDLDGVADLQDDCPAAREDMDGRADEDGCPDEDDDRDGMLAAVDDCPDDAETVNGYLDQDGCPDVVPQVERPATAAPAATSPRLIDSPAAEVPRVAPIDTGDPAAPRIEHPAPVQPQLQTAAAPVEVVPTCRDLNINLGARIYFEPASAEIEPAAYAQLNELVDTLQAHPEIERVLVEGHSDGAEEAGGAFDLSQQRADAIRFYLIERGIEPDRLVGRGMGDQHPTADNDDREGRAQNRRVVFDILAPRGCSG